MQKKIKVAIIGYGKMGKIRHETIEKLGHDVVSIYDPKEMVKDKGASLEDIYDNPNIEIVFVCTPNFFNKEYTIRGLKAGKHIFCEKPPAFNSKDIKEVIEYEKKSRKKLMYGFNHRHHCSVRQMKYLISNGKYGKVLWMRGRYGKSSSEDFFTTWRSKKDLAGGGILLDQGIHLLDLFLHMAGEFDKISAFLSNDYWKLPGIEDNAFIIFKNTKKRITASLHSTMTQWRHIFSFEVFLEKGWIVLNGLRTPSGSYGNEVLSISDNSNNCAHSKPNEIHEYNTDDSWMKETKYFFDHIINDEPIHIANSNDAYIVMKTIDQIYKEKDF